MDTRPIENAFDNFTNSGAQKAADAAARAFEVAGARIEKTLIKAAKTGELSFNDMAEAILKDLARLAVTQIVTNPLQAVLPVTGAGQSQSPAAPMNITLNVSGVSDAAGFNKSQGQISAALARAVSDGQRFF